MGPQWHFPTDPDGEFRGFNDPGVVQFAKLTALVREVIQNSVDAAALPGQPVRVAFSLSNVPVANIGGLDLRQHLAECMAWKGNRTPPAAQKFFEKAVRMLGGESIPTLVISDFGTTGLRGAMTKEPNSEWGQLLLGVGMSAKKGGTGGTYGVGKYAPFGLSALRTVLYRTRDLDGHCALAGIARLTTHERRGKQLKDVGWYGYPDRLPVTRDLEGLSPCNRAEPGTDLFILGFESGSSWQREVIGAVLENFLVTLDAGHLVVNVGDELVSKDTLAEYVDRYAEVRTQGFFRALRHPDLHCVEPFSFAGGVGELEVWLARSPTSPGKYIYEARQTGMRISLHPHRSPLSCSGILVARGLDLNSRLRALEPPAHDKWDLERSHRGEADRNMVREMRAWVAQLVQRLSEAPIESGDVVGLADYLPDSDDGPVRHEAGQSESAGEPLPVIRVPRGVPRSKVRTTAGRAKGALHPASDESRSDSRSPGGDTRSTGGDGDGGKVALGKARVWCRNGRDLYRVQIQVPTYQSVVLQVAAVGESGEENLRVATARDGSGSEIPVRADGCIGPVALTAGGNAVLDVRLADGLRSALRITAREAW